MTKTIECYYDFASPNVYLADQVLPAIAERAGAEIDYIPCLLGGIFKATGNQAPMIAFAGVKGKVDYEMLEVRRFIEAHDLKAFRMNPNFPGNTLTMMRTMIAANEEGVGAPYRRAVATALWEDGADIGKREVLAETLTAAGLDAEALIARAAAPEIKARLAELTAAAVDRGVFGLPTWFVGDEMFYGKERLGQIEQALTR